VGILVSFLAVIPARRLSIAAYCASGTSWESKSHTVWKSPSTYGQGALKVLKKRKSRKKKRM
jgi:hypothetical protein